jgi:hypothetical protein
VLEDGVAPGGPAQVAQPGDEHREHGEADRLAAVQPGLRRGVAVQAAPEEDHQRDL